MTSLLNRRYKILSVLATGGFSQTYLVEDTHSPTHRQCVLKQLKPPSPDPQIQSLMQARFQREAVILEMLGERTTSIPKLYAYFVENDQYYLVQELIEGQTLKAWIQTSGCQNEATVAALLLNILPVLAQVHEAGIIHRDIKPENIILRRHDRQPVLIDFGAVKEVVTTVMNPQGQPVSSIVIGTPGFMPPEQATGHPLPQSDLYCLGLTAIFMLTGKLPYELPMDLPTGAYQWRPEVPNLSPRLAAVLSQAIRYAPRDRFPSAQAFLQALQTPHQPEFDIAAIPDTRLAKTLTPKNSANALTQTSETSPRSRSVLITLLIIGGVVALGGLGIAAMQLGAWIEAQQIVTNPLPVSPDPEPPWFSAIAFSDSAQSYGYSYAYTTRSEAETRALQECTDRGADDCRLLIEFENSCGALAQASNGAYGSGSGSTAEVANATAILVCGQFGGDNCEVTLRVCPPNDIFQRSL
ncbi:DUF4189 domain-containing protein [Synechococcales cyanobacterium C]|uniref:non-specific serine/threonine protein kinase n=1 Tax=Petrachloros mirabilis ULC683 TaxID=2781853 RepID=A0A8K2A0U9_9CYAN|nr:DUF4189 domain-containing protein [Petrachloros mirabilis]NCJ07337.1 DUF4189 domain-containing protein [Petrachloros mirabilis ULC683]